MSEHVKPFLNRLVIVFGQPKTEDVETFLSEYIRILKRFTLSELTAGIDYLLLQHRMRSFPTIAECVSAVQDARDAEASLHPPKKDDPLYVGWRPADLAIADRMCRSPIGRQAMQDGWLAGLHTFVAREHRYPNSSEQAEIIATARFVDRCAAGSMPLGFGQSALQKLALSFLERRTKLANHLFADDARSLAMSGDAG